MNKQELIQTHGLLDRIRKEFAEDNPNTVTVGECPTYEDIGVSSTDIHRSKSDHKDAVLALANDIAEALPEQEQEAEQTEQAVTAAK